MTALPKRNPQPSQVLARFLMLCLCVMAAAWTCHGIYAGHRVASYSFEESLRLARQPGQQTAACLQLRLRIVEAVKVLRDAGHDGRLAVEAIHQETR